MIRRPPRSTQSRSSAASDVYKRQVADDAMLVVGRPREGETDCHRLRRHHGRLARSGTSLHAVAYATKTGDQQMQELVDGARCCGECHRRYDLAPAPDGAEDQIGAAGVE